MKVQLKPHIKCHCEPQWAKQSQIIWDCFVPRRNCRGPRNDPPYAGKPRISTETEVKSFTPLYRGFTLLELLVVIAIIAILAGLVIPNLMGAKTRAKIAAAKTDLQTIAGAMMTYYTVFGDYPPTSLEGFKGNIRLNPTNQGIESLVACLSTKGEGGPFLGQWKEDRYTNLDKDSAPENLTNWWFGDNQLRELVDSWRNPFVYFHARDYEAAQIYGRYINNIQEEFIALPQISTRTNTFHNPLGYQLWSLGPNEENNNGAEDDIPNW